jgi:hypothetical protein
MAQGARSVKVAERIFLSLAIGIAGETTARADTQMVSLEVGTERDAHDVSLPLLNYDLLTAIRFQDNGILWGGQLQNIRRADHGLVSWATEALAGYSYKYTPSAMLTGSIAVGERFASDKDFPYYVFRLSNDVRIAPNMIWNSLTIRYRNSFDEQDHYLNSQIGTGVTYQLNDSAAVYGRSFLVFGQQYQLEGIGLSIGIRTTF